MPNPATIVSTVPRWAGVSAAAPASVGPIWLSAQASAPIAEARIAAPITSNLRWTRPSFDTKTSRTPAATSASGGLIQNTDGQPKVLVSQPPRTGPPAVVRADAAAHTPIARFLSARG